MRSMTGFATAQGAFAAVEGEPPTAWRWDLRSVNGKGLEVRFRAPPGWDGEEPKWRARVSEACARGSLSAALTIAGPATARAPSLNALALERAIAAALAAQAQAEAAGLATAPISIEGLLGLRGVFASDPEAETDGQSQRGAPDAALAEAARDGLSAALADLVSARFAEGARLRDILAERLETIAGLVSEADAAAHARADGAAERLRERVAALLTAAAGESAQLDEARLAQELAQLAMKSDVSEEIDRLRAHISAARDLLAKAAPVGRKLEFLAQEFHREANTLCAKSQDAALTEAGLALKVVIDQVREQAANVE